MHDVYSVSLINMNNISLLYVAVKCVEEMRRLLFRTEESSPTIGSQVY